MSTLLLMKLFESSPQKYDQGIRLLTGGKLDDVYDRLTSQVREGDRVLDVGCGTGAWSLRAAKKGAAVKAMDVNPGMLDIAREKAEKESLSPYIEFAERGVAELDKEQSQHYDVVTSGLCLSELTDQEVDFVLQEVRRILKIGGLFLVADEVRPKGFVRRVFTGLFRMLLAVLVFFISRTSTRPLKDFPRRLEDRKFEVLSSELFHGQTLLALTARKPAKNSP